MAYPDNNFDLDQEEADQYGGADADVFDSDAWTFVTGLVRKIARRFFSHVRVPWSGAVVVVQEGVTLGDVVAMDVTRDYTDPTTQQKLPYIAKYATIVAAGGTTEIVGVVVAGASALGKAQVATGGWLPPTYTGLTAMTGGSLVSVNATSSRMQAWNAGDESIGTASPSGCVALKFPGRVA
jgi:hypothetical protein